MRSFNIGDRCKCTETDRRTGEKTVYHGRVSSIEVFRDSTSIPSIDDIENPLYGIKTDDGRFMSFSEKDMKHE